MMAKGDIYRKIRLSMLLEQSEFGKLVGVKESTISNYERGVRTPRYKTIRRIKELADENNIKVSIDELLENK